MDAELPGTRTRRAGRDEAPLASEGPAMLLPWLPRGGSLTPDQWNARHRGILWVLWVHVPLLTAFGLYGGVDRWVSHARYENWGLAVSLLEGGIIALLALAATLPSLSRRVRSIAASVGLITCSAVLTQFSGGFIEAHFHFFVMVGVIAMYVDWMPFLLSIGYVVVHHGVVGTAAPGSVYNHPAAIAHPWNWAIIHAFFVLCLSAAQVAHWAISEHARARTELVLRSAGDGIVGFGRDHTIAFANPAAASMLGFANEALTGRKVEDVIRMVGQDGGSSRDHLTTVLTGTHSQTAEGHLLRPDGSRMPIEWNCRPIEDQGRVTGGVLTFRDTTARTAAVRALVDREQKLSEAQRLARLGSWEWDLVTGEVVWSEEMYHIHGMEARSEAIDFAAATQQVGEEDRARMDERIKADFNKARNLWKLEGKTEMATSSLEYRITRPDGSVRVLHGQGRIHMSTAGEPVRLAGTVQDVTERKQIELERKEAEGRAREVQALRAQDEFKTRFINAAAHELNTPLTTTGIQLAILENTATENLTEGQQQAVALLGRNQARFSRLVGDLLDASRLQSGRLGMQRKSHDLAESLREAYRVTLPGAQERGVEVTLDVTESLPVVADPDRIHQVLLNLIGNSLKFTAPGGHIRIEGAAVGDAAVVSVSDDGIGIDAENLEAVFEPFSQVHYEQQQRREGSGLGLYITRNILDMHGGSIRAESDGPGKGTSFTFQIPLRSVESRGSITRVDRIHASDRAAP